jgi:hypothetical protein
MRSILDFPARFLSDKNKYLSYFHELLKLMSGAAYITSMYISVMMVKCGEVHLVQPEDVDYLGHCSASARPRLISGPARSIAEVKTAITWLVQDPLKKALPELCLSKTHQTQLW